MMTLRLEPWPRPPIRFMCFLLLLSMLVGSAGSLPRPPLQAALAPLPGAPGLEVPPTPRAPQSAVPQIPPGLSGVRTFVDRDETVSINWMSDRAYDIAIDYGPTAQLGRRAWPQQVDARRLTHGGFVNALSLPAWPELRFYQIRAFLPGTRQTAALSGIQAVGHANAPTAGTHTQHDHVAMMAAMGGAQHDHTAMMAAMGSAPDEDAAPAPGVAASVNAQTSVPAPGMISNQVYCEYGGSGGGPLGDPRPPCPTQPSVGDPITLGDGAFHVGIPCLTLGGKGLPVSVGLGYSSHMWFDGIGMSSIGTGWTVGYSRRLTFTNLTADYFTPTPSLMFTLESGERWPFYRSPANDGTYTNGPGNYTKLISNTVTNEYVLTYRNGMQDVFASNGILKRVQDRFGNQTQISPISASGVISVTNARTNQTILMVHQQRVENGQTIWKLTQIKDGASNGGTARQITLGYNTSGQLTSVTDPIGRVYTFAYDTSGRLDTYYDPNNNPATNANARATRNVYQNDGFNHRVRTQTLPNGSTVDLSFSYSAPIGYLTVTHNQGKPDQRSVTYQMYTRANGGLAGAITQVSIPNSSNVVSLVYDSNGNVQTETDPLSRKVEYLYDTAGNQLEVRDYNNAPTNSTYDTIRMTYDSYGNMTSVTDPAGAVTKTTYTAQGAPSTIARVAVIGGTTITQTTTIQSNSFGQVTAVQLPDGTWNTQSYDTRGYPTTATYDANYGGNTGRIALTAGTVYDWRGYMTSNTDQQGITTSFTNNAIGWVTSKVVDTATGGLAVRTNYTYDQVGNITQVVDDAGTGRANATWRFAYGMVGVEGDYDVITMTNALNQATVYAYTNNGEIKSEKDPLGRTVTYTYTAEGWPGRTIAPDNRVIQDVRYNIAGDISSVRDARGVTVEYAYDGKGRVATTRLGTTAIGTWPAITATYTATYDANDRMVSIKNPLGQNDTTRSYDGFNRLAWEQDALGNRTTYSYDNARNWLALMTVGSNNTSEQVQTQYSYDTLARLTQQVVDPGTGRKNLTTRYRYTTTGSTDRWHLQEMQDPRNNTTINRYNSLGLLSQVTDALGGVTTYVNDRLGRTTVVTDALGRATTYGFDLLNRMTSTARNGQTESWSYNADSTLKSHTDFAGQITNYSYDVSRRMTGIDYAGTSADASFGYFSNNMLRAVTDTLGVTTYDYDALNRLAKRTRGGRTVGYSYNKNSDLTGLDYWGRGSVAYGYDAARRVTSVSPWGAAATTLTYRSTNLLASQTRPNSVVTNYFYDTAGRQTSVKHLKSGVITLNTAYYLDANGNRIQSVDVTYGNSYASYDALNRLISASDWDALPDGNQGTLTYAYDAVGNVTSFKGAARTYDASDRLTNAGVTHDANGNLTNDGTTAYSYDSANRLTQTVKGGVTTSYGYDGLGNLVRETSGSTTKDLVLDEQGALSRILGEISGTTEQIYAYGPDGLTAQRQVLSGTPQGIVYPLLDGIGSVRQLTNSSGTSIKNYVYDAFGGIRYQDVGSGTTTLGFAGERRGADGTINMRARVYQPALGRFLQRDSFAGFLSDPQSLNRYAYAQNNPVNWTDPSGHFAWTLGGVLLVGGAILSAPVSAPVAALAIGGAVLVGGAIGYARYRSEQEASTPTPMPTPSPSPGPRPTNTPSPSPSPSPEVRVPPRTGTDQEPCRCRRQRGPAQIVDLERDGTRVTYVDAISRYGNYAPRINDDDRTHSQVRSNGYSYDDAGHIIASSLGGRDVFDNLVPMARDFNRSGGDYNRWEANARRYRRETCVVRIRVALHYGDRGRPNRPDWIEFEATAGDGRRDYLFAPNPLPYGRRTPAPTPRLFQP